MPLNLFSPKLIKGDECPQCACPTFVPGEEIHNGVGMQQVSPGWCDWCGYYEGHAVNEADNWALYEKCWELQIDPTGGYLEYHGA